MSSEINELLELMQKNPTLVSEVFRKDAALRNRVLEWGELLEAGRQVTAGGFARYYAEQYGRPLPKVFHSVAEEFAWAYHNRKGVILEGWRGMGKSTFFLAWCPYVIGVNPVGSTALIRINDGKAKEMGKAISDIIRTNLGWKKIFPHVVPDEQAGWSVENGFEVLDTRLTGGGKDKDEAGYAKWRMMCLANHLSEKSLVCNGVESGSNIGLHPTNGMWFDDLHDEDNTRSQAELKKVTDIIQGNFVPTWFSAGGSPTLGVFCTPWSDNPPDAYVVMNRTGLFKKVSIPIFTDDPNGVEIPAETTDGNAIDPEYAGRKIKPTWEEAFNAQRIADIIHAAKSRFGQMYLLDPSLSKPKSFRYMTYPHQEIRWNDWQMVLGVDPVTWVKGISTGQGVSHFAAVQLLKTHYNTVVVADGVVEKMDALQGQEYIMRTQRTFSKNYRGASIEKNGGGVIFIAMLTRMPGVLYNGHEVRELGSGRKKERLYPFLQPLFASGSVQISDGDTPFLNFAREAMDVFPNYEEDSPYADFFDALAMGLLDIPEIWTKVVWNLVPNERQSIWTMKKKSADPFLAALEGRR